MGIGEKFEEMIKLSKRRAELNYKLNYCLKLNKHCKEVEEELELLEKRIKEIEKEIEAFGIEFFVPFEKEIKAFNERLSHYSVEQISLALRRKEGSAWELLKAKAEIVKNNIFHAKQIGKLVELLLSLDEEKRKKIIEMVKAGKIFEEVEIEKEKGLKLAKYLSRIGINAYWEDGKLIDKPFPFKEVGVEIAGEVVYIPESVVEEVLKNEEELKRISIKIQMKNAERQIKKFTEKEMEEFEALQKKYLSLLKKREEFLKKYRD